MKRILIAGIGNIFHGDDAFGCEVVRQLKHCALRDEVTVTDFGIRSYDLAYALTDGYHATILVDAAPRGQQPGTLYLIQPDVNHLDALEPTAVNAHSMNPVSVIQMAESLGGVRGKLFLVGCEPAELENDSGEFGLSKRVQEAIPEALAMIESLVANLLGLRKQKRRTKTDLVPV